MKIEIKTKHNRRRIHFFHKKKNSREFRASELTLKISISTKLSLNHFNNNKNNPVFSFYEIFFSDFFSNPSFGSLKQHFQTNNLLDFSSDLMIGDLRVNIYLRI